MGGPPGEPRRRRRWPSWLAVAAWAALVFGLGSGGFSEASTSRFVRPLLEWLLPNAAPQTLESLHYAIRKASHMAEYAVLAALAWRAGRQDLARLPAAAVSLGLVLAVAVMDEARQAGLATRGGSARDVALDVVGGVLALALLLALRALRRRAAASTG